MMRSTRPRGRGFTLIEVTVVVAMMGLVAAVLAAVFAAVVRTAPRNVDRLDDASSLLGLTTWIPRDVASASPSSFDVGDRPTSCGSGVASPSQGLLELRWVEGSTTRVVDYRFENDTPATGRIVRYSCVAGGPATGAPMTAAFPVIPASASPKPSEHPAPVDITTYGTPGDIRGVRVEVIVLDTDGSTTRSLLTLDAETLNVVTTLPPPTTVAATTTTTTSTTVPPSNLPPFAADLFVQVRLDQRVEGVVLPATDPEGGSLSATIVSSAPQLDIDINPSGSITARIEAEPGDGAQEGQSYQFTYRVSDGTSLSNVGTVTVLVDSSLPPGETTTTSSTTTTTPTTTTPCAVSVVSVAPSPVARKNNGTLVDDVVVRITRTGSCLPLVLTFDPDPTDSNVIPQEVAFNAGTEVTIRKVQYTWNNSGPLPWAYPLSVRQGANGPVMATATLTVGP